jgi:hypothetical protein
MKFSGIKKQQQRRVPVTTRRHCAARFNGPSVSFLFSLVLGLFNLLLYGWLTEE